MLSQSQNDCSMLVRTVDDPTRYGVVRTKDEKIVEILEKVKNPPTNLVNCGIYILDTNIFKYIGLTKQSQRGEYELTTSLQLQIDERNNLRFVVCDTPEDLIDVGTKEMYEMLL